MRTDLGPDGEDVVSAGAEGERRLATGLAQGPEPPAAGGRSRAPRCSGASTHGASPELLAAVLGEPVHVVDERLEVAVEGPAEQRRRADVEASNSGPVAWVEVDGRPLDLGVAGLPDVPVDGAKRHVDRSVDEAGGDGVEVLVDEVAGCAAASSRRRWRHWRSSKSSRGAS